MSHVKLLGGDYGWHVQQTSQWVARSFELSGHARPRFWLDGVWNFPLAGFPFSAHGAHAGVRGDACPLVGSSFEDIAGDSAIENRGGSLVLAGVEAKGVRGGGERCSCRDSAAGKTNVKLWAAGAAMVNGK